MISKENSEHYSWGDNCDGWHLVKSQELSVIQESVPSGCHEKRHFHEHSEQFFFVLAGVASLEFLVFKVLQDLNKNNVTRARER